MTSNMEPGLIVAVSAVAVSIASLALAAWTAYVQRRHMRLSVRPVATISVADYENRVGVSIMNRGLGPMYIHALKVSVDDGASYGAVLSHMPALEPGVLWADFVEDVAGTTLEQGAQLDLIRLEGRPDDDAYRVSRDRVRQALSRLVVRVDYEDLYGQRMLPSERPLTWFARHGA